MMMMMMMTVKPVCIELIVVLNFVLCFPCFVDNFLNVFLNPASFVDIFWPHCHDSQYGNI